MKLIQVICFTGALTLIANTTYARPVIHIDVEDLMDVHSDFLHRTRLQFQARLQRWVTPARPLAHEARWADRPEAAYMALAIVARTLLDLDIVIMGGNLRETIFDSRSMEFDRETQLQLTRTALEDYANNGLLAELMRKGLNLITSQDKKYFGPSENVDTFFRPLSENVDTFFRPLLKGHYLNLQPFGIRYEFFSNLKKLMTLMKLVSSGAPQRAPELKAEIQRHIHTSLLESEYYFRAMKLGQDPQNWLDFLGLTQHWVSIYIPEEVQQHFLDTFWHIEAQLEYAPSVDSYWRLKKYSANSFVIIPGCLLPLVIAGLTLMYLQVSVGINNLPFTLKFLIFTLPSFIWVTYAIHGVWDIGLSIKGLPNPILRYITRKFPFTTRSDPEERYLPHILKCK